MASRIWKWHVIKPGFVIDPLTLLFDKVGYQIGKNPGYFIIVIFLVYALLGTGLQRIKLVTNIEYLYTPEDSETFVDRKLIENNFPMHPSNNFDYGRKTRIGRLALVHVMPLKTESILNEKVFQDVLKLDYFVNSIEITGMDNVWTYKDLCAKSDNLCFTNDYLLLGRIIKDLETGNKTIKYPLQINRNSFNYYASNLGGVITAKDGSVKSARMLRLLYILDDSSEIKDQLSIMWEQKLSEELMSYRMDNYTITFWTTSCLEKELHELTLDAFPLFVGNVIIVLVFTVITSLSADWVRSKPLVGMCGALSSCISTAAAFGTLIYCGIPYIDIHLAIPFLLLGIGMDDTFVMLAAWSRTDTAKSVEERLSKTYSEAAVAVTITSLTNILSFLVGIITPFPCVYLFCSYAACSIFFMYICQITFFGGCLAISGKAEEKNLHSVICLPIKHKSLAQDRNILFRYFCTGGPNPNNRRSQNETTKKVLAAALFRDYVAPTLGLKPVKAIIILLYILYLAIAIWGCCVVHEGIELELLHPYSSVAIKFHQEENLYFNRYNDRIQVVINEPLEYWKPEVQQEVEHVLQKFENAPHIADSYLTESWLRYFLKMVKDERSSTLFSNFNLTNKIDFLIALQRIFLKAPVFKIFKNDILFSKNKTDILSSRFILQADGLDNVGQKTEMFKDLKSIAGSFPYDVRVYNNLFPFYDQFLIVSVTSLKSIGTATLIMIFVSLLFLTKISCVVIVVIAVISIEMGVVGFMSFWGVHLDTVSMINLIMCIGFSVDFVAHISHAYISCPDNEIPNNKLRTALYSVGLPILQGGISSALGIMLLILIPAYTFIVFVKVVFLVVIISILHALIMIPVLFTMFDSLGRTKNHSVIEGSENEQASNQQEQMKKSAIKLVRSLSNTVMPVNYIMFENINNSNRILKRRVSSPATLKLSVKEYTNSAFMGDVSNEKIIDEGLEEVTN
ncbi:patched domain-containing protein 3-like [Centruroides sculpturatus]|uniref:patched domain-containing protein 3-like n=1 Tax=Centruroides sculpturatus TaxID=218467 RepID=UPI000C6EA060|nr:patched domain-containing protein 3-like [Centruroides sculpturatus]